MSSVRRGVVEGRKSAAVAVILFSCLGAWSWAAMSSHHDRGDLVTDGGMLFLVVVCGMVAYRSPLLADRIVFGATSAAFLLAVVATGAFLDPTAILVVKVIESLMWTTAAVTGAVVLVRGSKHDRHGGSSSPSPRSRRES